MKNIPLLHVLTAIIVSIVLIGCDSSSPFTPAHYSSTCSAMLIVPQAPNSLWDRMASEFTFKTHASNTRVQRFIKQYTREESYRLVKLSEQATPYLFHILQLIEERGLPPELALLPIIESEYRPTAASNKGAVGIWQLQSVTGKLYGIQQDQWYDGRRDVDVATKAALDYLQFLYEKFDHDWLLALAAYNAGGGRVSNAIKINKRKGLPTDYWSLSLPQETQYFVPKFLSLVHLIQNHRKLSINLASIPNKPYLASVKVEKQIGLQEAAKLAQADYKEVKTLNAAYRAQVTHPAKGPRHIFLPVKHVATFNTNYSNMLQAKAAAAAVKAKVTPKAAAVAKLPVKAPIKAKVKPPMPVQVITVATTHTVNSGDTLHLIASKYRTTVKSIMRKNSLKSDVIHLGQQLAI
jgi:membrane-bound lytic murein transglycosylase D